MLIAIDFDGTIVEHAYPEIGSAVPGALETLKELHEHGHKLILFTMRSGEFLDEAEEYLKENGISLYGVNRNPEQHNWTTSPKVYAKRYIDDAALGVPLIHPRDGGRAYVNWTEIRRLLVVEGVLPAKRAKHQLGKS